MELKRLLTRANALLLQGAYQGAESFIEQAMAEADKLKKELDELDTLRTRVTEMAAEVERLTTENANLQSVIDEINAQEPFRWFLADRVNKSEDMLTEVTGNIDPAREVLMPMYLRPIPAQQSPAVVVPDEIWPDKLVELITKAILFEDDGSTEQWEENINLGKAALKAIPNDWQLVPKFVTKEMRIGAWASAAEIRPNIKSMLEVMWADLLKHSPLYTGDPSPRITDQDAREIFIHIGFPEMMFGDWMKNRGGRALLNKLNGDQNGK